MIADYEEITQELLTNFREGDSRLFNPGFRIFSNFYQILPGSCTDWSGYPTSGKTELLLEILFNTAKFYNHKSLLFVPDAGTKAEVLADLVVRYSGKQFDEFYTNREGEKIKCINRITEKEIMRYVPEVKQNFTFYSARS